MPHDLAGVSVLVAGGGLAGLCAARDLATWGATVTLLEARHRIGGRVLTVRDGFLQSQHAEAGGDLIDEAHGEIRALARELGLSLSRILKQGFGYVRAGADGHVRTVEPSTATRGWDRLAKALSDHIRPYVLAERRWDTPIAAALARRSVAEWLDDIKADDELRATAVGLRGFFLADAQQLSLLALVDQFSTGDDWPAAMFRIDGGNDQLTFRLAASLGERVLLGTELVAVTQRGSHVRASVKTGGKLAQLTADYAVLTLPASLLRRLPITPALPARQHDAIRRLVYGRATKTLLQFPTRFWRAPGRPRAFGSPLGFGAVWEGNEEQRGRAGILALLAGGSASDQTAAIVAHEGVDGLARALDWLGSQGHAPVASHQVRWEADPWARGGYAVFDSSFPPALRSALAEPCGRLFFAGEHTSIKWQGYMNGAVESGRRAAAEIRATHELGGLPSEPRQPSGGPLAG